MSTCAVKLPVTLCLIEITSTVFETSETQLQWFGYKKRFDGTKLPRREWDLKVEGRIFTDGMAKNGTVHPGTGGLHTTECNMIRNILAI
jgi:hypothetical protein